MLYEILKFIFHFSVRIFYKNIRINNLALLPANKPVILACNHPNSFMDAIVLSVNIKQQLNYLARSDVFNSPIKKRVLGTMNLVPIYRLQEGAEKLHKNEETFEVCNLRLAKNETILIFSEGLCVQERRLRKLKKGTARMAFGAEESQNFNMDLLIVPVGLNYSKKGKFRSNLFINFGEPIKVKEFINQHKDKAKAVNDITACLDKKLKELIVIIEDKENDMLVEQIEDLFKKDLLIRDRLSSNQMENNLLASKNIAATVNNLSQKDPLQLKKLRLKTEDYLTKMSELNLEADMLSAKSIETLSAFKLVGYFFLLLLAFPFHVYGLVNNYIPGRISYLLTKKAVKNEEFFSSVLIAAGTFLFLIFYLIQALLVDFVFHNHYASGFYLLSLPLSGICVLYYWEYLKFTAGKWKLYSLKKHHSPLLNNLCKTKEEIIQEIEHEQVVYCQETKVNTVKASREKIPSIQ